MLKPIKRSTPSCKYARPWASFFGNSVLRVFLVICRHFYKFCRRLAIAKNLAYHSAHHLKLMSAQIVQFSWENESTPIFTSRENGALSQQRLVFNESFSLEILDGPDCIGFHTREGWVACPYASKGMRKCENCKQKEGLMIEQFCDGYNLDLFSPEDVERLNTPHYLYLALFQRDLFKIGVSAMGRGLLRQIEQGTHYALILAEGMNGILARQIETLLRRSGIPDKIQLAQKKDFLFP